MTTGKRMERTERDFRCAISHTVIGQTNCLICARRRQLTFIILLLNQLIVSYQWKSVKSLKTKQFAREDLSLLYNCVLRRKNILFPTKEFTRFPYKKFFFFFTRKQSRTVFAVHLQFLKRHPCPKSD